MSKQKILIVDDEIILTKMLKLNLDEDNSYQTEILNDARKALDYIKEYMPDLVLLDVMMPGIQGSEIADSILNDKKLKHIKIIFLTAIVTRNECPGGSKKIGGRRFIAKPVKADELIEAIKKELA
ncbi:MAG: CheY-like chemotaxis protein [Enterobacterales bacterium]|jgi:CheY-like chemotaxis protein